MTQHRTYRDFELRITSEGGQFFGEVLDSPAGTRCAKSPLKFSFAGARMQEVLLRLENALLRKSSRIRSGPGNAQEKIIREFGGELFGSAIESSREILLLYEKSRSIVQSQPNQRMRFKLRVDAPELAQLPWEFMYDGRDKEYVTFAAAPIARFIESSQASVELPIVGPLRILGMVADPGDRDPSGPWERLDTDAERHRIDQAVQALQSEGAVDFQWVPGGTATDLLDMMGRGPWHVFHFIGHGGVGGSGEDDEGFVVLEDEFGRGSETSARKLVRILGDSGLRLAVLNCCESGRGTTANPLASPGASLVNAGLSAAIAMQFPISDQAAIRLAGGFYGALANRMSVDAAVRRARVEMNLLSDVEWGIPVLFTRSKDGHIFSESFEGGDVLTPQPPQAAASEGQPVAEGAPAPAAEPAPARAKSDSDSGPSSDFALFSQQARMRAELTTHAKLEEMSEHALSAFIEAARAGLEADDTQLVKRVAEAHYRLGRLKRKGNLKEAFVHFNAAIELDPTRPEYFRRRANVKAMLGQNGAALRDIQAAILLDDGVAELHWTLGLLHTLMAEEGDGPQHQKAAEAAYTEAIRIDPENARYHDSRSTVRTQRGDFEGAVADLTRVLELDPDNAGVRRRRGLVREKAGDAAGAAQDFERAALGGAAAGGGRS